jgi:hypothetical protein
MHIICRDSADEQAGEVYSCRKMRRLPVDMVRPGIVRHGGEALDFTAEHVRDGDHHIAALPDLEGDPRRGIEWIREVLYLRLSGIVTVLPRGGCSTLGEGYGRGSRCAGGIPDLVGRGVGRGVDASAARARTLGAQVEQHVRGTRRLVLREGPRG